MNKTTKWNSGLYTMDMAIADNSRIRDAAERMMARRPDRAIAINAIGWRVSDAKFELIGKPVAR